MPFPRMDQALAEASRETSPPTAFVLSQADYAVFKVSSNAEKTVTIFHGTLPAGASSPAEWIYKTTPVTEATDSGSPSRLHVYKAQGALSDVFEF
jgi:hypothetical protein